MIFNKAKNYTFWGKITPEEEAMVDALVAPGHPSTPGYTDPAYPLLPRR